MGTLSRVLGAGKSSGASNLVARCMELTQRNADAALLLQRALFWMRHAKIQHGGKTWIAKTAADWCEETRLSPKRYERAVDRLRRLGLVETEQHRFRGHNITHLRLTERAVLELRAFGALGFPSSGEPESPKNGELHIQGETDREKQTGKDCVLPHADDLGEDSSEGDSGKEESHQAQSPSHPVELEHACPNEDEIASAIGLDPVSLAALEQIWRTRIAESYGGLVPNWTSKERGQMAHFRRVCPPVAARAVLEAVLRDWPMFVSLAKSNAGALNLPVRPNVGFLVKFAGDAVNLWQAKSKPKVPSLPQPHLAALTPHRSPAQPPAKLPQVEEKAPLEVVMAALCRSPTVK
jgi:hypothetical protein